LSQMKNSSLKTSQQKKIIGVWAVGMNGKPVLCLSHALNVAVSSEGDDKQ